LGQQHTINLFTRRLWQFRETPKIISESHPIDMIVKTNMSRGETVDRIAQRRIDVVTFIARASAIVGESTQFAKCFRQPNLPSSLIGTLCNANKARNIPTTERDTCYPIATLSSGMSASNRTKPY